ncbi:pyridoxamine 5'-phosphate oxidase family protein [Vannielia litorea]|uniref:pyridoxamine 5'-phosphate oxidase family protein n=1 Tax=Vannielia litorea TaxID=1217970 RepID=UPI001C93FF00|nr:pyridoxamine 5'-phosphate oxidase family protein [Vannielia litorea]MBY6048617.1 pyridoxamine 5'-phosphate oxidase family protein [Vannielia litorea]MBY6076031.1 pyridoxamine 5'-phosphate oxidase family protein [Vannielia litorea]
MATKTLPEVAELMAKIDFCMMETLAEDGRIAARPMSSNGDVEYRGESWFYSLDDTRKTRHIRADPRVGLAFQGSGGVLGLVGKPGAMVHVQGRATLTSDRAALQEHWVPDLEYWFKDGIDTPGLLLIRVDAEHIHYWDGEENGVVTP